MWFFKRRATNRRIERRSGLQVRVRTDVARARTARRVGTFFVSIGATLLALFIFWRAGEWVLQNVFFDDQSYAVRKVEVLADGTLTPEQVQRWANVRLGQNLVGLDLARIKRDLEAVPVIRSVIIERVLPGTLRIRVNERQPIAEVQVGRVQPDGRMQFSTYRLDAEGMVMQPLDAGRKTNAAFASEFPLITGVDPAEITLGRKLISSAGAAALRLVAGFEESSMVGLDDLQRVEVVSPEILQATTYLGSQVTFSVNQLDRQLARWRAVYDYGVARQKHLASLDLAVSNNVPARWQEPGSVPPTPPREPRTLRNRPRRHV